MKVRGVKIDEVFKIEWYQKIHHIVQTSKYIQKISKRNLKWTFILL